MGSSAKAEGGGCRGGQQAAAVDEGHVLSPGFLS
jgi:hypothetical protein